MTKQNIRKKYRGKFIVFEGLDGAGSTTQCSKLLELLNELGWPVAYTKEPSNGPMGLMIQLILAGRIQLNALGKSITDLSRESLALLFASDRLDHLEHEIEPTLTDGVSVICDRYYLSSFAYQLSDDKSNFGWLKSVNDKCIKPDLHIYIETSVTTCLKRISSSILRWKKQLYENKNKLETIAINYHYVMEELRNEGENILIVNGNQPIEMVFHELIEGIKVYFPKFFTKKESQQIDLLTDHLIKK